MANESKNMVSSLTVLQSSLVVLYQKARNYHWNVSGPEFFQLHTAFEKFYDALATDIDDVAERVRILGAPAVGTLAEMLVLSLVKEESGLYPDAKTMVKNITSDFQLVTDFIKSAAAKSQSEYQDEVTAGMLYGLAQNYEKTLWMLKETAKL